MERKLFRQLSKDLSGVSGFADPQRPPPHLAKDFLGAVVTLTIIGAIVLQVTNELASRCLAPRAGPGTCSGVAAVAEHARGAVTVSVAACAAVAAIAFIWYMFWGYKAKDRVRRDGGASGL